MNLELAINDAPPPITRLLVWFSAAATSAVAAALALNDKANGIESRVLYCETGGHHPENLRFIHEVSQWIGHTIEIVRNHKYLDLDHVIEKERLMNSPVGAKCTQQLKIRVRRELQRAATDLQIFGFHAGEVDRAGDFKTNWPEVRLSCPLITRNLFHDDCLALLRDAGIELPVLYRQGFKNNNCIGCVKGGMGYWNKIRVLYPEVFARRAKQERMINNSCINGTFLDQLDPESGRYEADPDIACEGHCVTAKAELRNCDS
mgnify:CR=1 FL=1